MLEVELKAKLTPEQAAGLPERLEALGYTASAHLRETDVYWNGVDRDFRKTDEALRLRSLEDLEIQADETLLTYKGPKEDSRSHTRAEYETSVGSLSAARDLLRALGYQDLFTVEKVRREFARKRITVCLDQVTGLGDYLELETLLEDPAGRDAAVDSLLELLDTLCVSREALRRESYLELLMDSATV